MTGTSTLHVRTLTDGGQAPDEIAGEVIAFIDGAVRSLDLAMYSMRLPGDLGDAVAGSIRRAAARGIAVRILYNAPDGDHGASASPRPQTRPEILRDLGVPLVAIPGDEDLMHHKYVVRDGVDVWCGSANWTLDAWSRQENLIVTVHNAALAAAYAHNFADLWRRRSVEGSGTTSTRAIDLGTDRTVRPWFAPGRGEQLSHRIATAIGRARRRVRIASPVITAAPILGTLAEVAMEGRVDVAGVCDATQVDEVIDNWRLNGNAAWRIPLLEQVLAGARFTGKRSTPWSPDVAHDAMHAKVTVCDDMVFVGSFNLSRSGERNAENVLEIRDAGLADRLAAWIERLRETYPSPVLAPPQ